MNNSIIKYVIKGMVRSKIDDQKKNAIIRRCIANNIEDDEVFSLITEDVIRMLEEGKAVQEVEHIQDKLEKSRLKNGYFDVRSYIL